MSMEKGFIIKLVAGDYSVICNHQIFLCKARGLFRNQNQSPMVGDEVLFTYDKTTNHGVIHQILPRKNQLLRPPVANIDIALIVMSTIEPSFDAYLVDKLTVNITEYKVCVGKYLFDHEFNYSTAMDSVLKNIIDTCIQNKCYFCY